MPSVKKSPSWLPGLLARVEAGETFHVVDVETTGSSPGASRVIELATVSVRGGEIVDRFETLIDPGVPVPFWITRLTGINSRMLRGQPAPAEAWERWVEHLGGDSDVGHFVAHNAPFDWGFLRSEFSREGREWPFSERFCTVSMARYCLPELPSRSLEALIAHFRLRTEARHRALADAEATADIFLRLLAQLRRAAQA